MPMVIRLLIVLILFVSPAFGAVYIVDNGSIETADSTSWSGIDGEAYTTTTFPSGAVGYNSLEDIYNSGSGVSGLSAGDEIYLRAGTYTEDYDTSHIYLTRTAMPLPYNVDGTGWGDDERILFTSYPGEWAILDANGATNCVLGCWGGGHSAGTLDWCIPEYWIIERLELTGSESTSSSCGLGIHGGPWKVRYLYIHDNPSTEDCEENAGGIRGYHFRLGSTIEYCYFTNNTAADFWNCGNIVNFSDYVQTRSGFDIDDSRANFIVRYNRMDGAYVGYKDKAFQFLKTSDSDMTYQEYHGDIHHNIITSVSYAIESDGEFEQIHHNICDGGGIQCTWNSSGVTNVDTAMLDRVVYNNTIIGGPLSFGIGYNTDPGINKDFRSYAYNNIVAEYGHTTENASISLCAQACAGGYCDSAIADCIPNWTTSVIDRNLIYDPQYADHINEPYSEGLESTRWYTVSEFNSYQSVTNYTNSTSGLFLGATGADQYRTDGDFIIGSSTISAGGVGSSHPYLSGVTFPDYVGATNPDDDDWVAGVLALDSTYMTSATNGSDPSWVEGDPEEEPTSGTSSISINGASSIFTGGASSIE